MADAFVRRCRPLLGTFVEIAVPTDHAGAVDAAFGVVEHLHARMSFHDARSDLAALRRAPAGTMVAIDVDTVAVLRSAASLHAASNGLFDIGIGRILVDRGFLPTPDIDMARYVGDARDIEIIDDRHVRCTRPVLIDLGGIAKGYAVDRAVDALKKAGVPAAIVNAGGDLRAFGTHMQTVHLRGADGGIEATLTIGDLALASSSHRPAHPGGPTPHVGHNGDVVHAGAAVTVAADTCIIADALTKIVLADPTSAAAILSAWGAEIVPRSPNLLAA